MHRLLAAQFAAHHLDGAIGDHLVDVHVGLCAASGLPNHQWKVLVPLAFNHLVGSLDDVVGNVAVQSEALVDSGCRLQQLQSTDVIPVVVVVVVCVIETTHLLQDAKRMNHLQWHSLMLTANLEVLDRSETRIKQQCIRHTQQPTTTANNHNKADCYRCVWQPQ
jgi:hypothetical protein